MGNQQQTVASAAPIADGSQNLVCRSSNGGFIAGRDGQHEFVHAASQQAAPQGYIGDWDAQCGRSGEGVQVWPDGRRYAGQFFHDAMSGDAVMSWPDGRRYIGQYSNNRKHGVGRFLWPDGRLFEGQWEMGRKHGRGYYRDSEIYTGEYSDGARHGDGVLTWPDGKRYSGQFDRGDYHGLAMMRWPDGRRYVGMYFRNRKHGEGVFCWPDGRRYEGEWRSGMRHGQGRFVDAQGRSRSGIWNEDRLVDDLLVGIARQSEKAERGRCYAACQAAQRDADVSERTVLQPSGSCASAGKLRSDAPQVPQEVPSAREHAHREMEPGIAAFTQPLPGEQQADTGPAGRSHSSPPAPRPPGAESAVQRDRRRAGRRNLGK